MLSADTRPVVNRYQILGKLGAGGMGSVYRVHDRLTQQTLALKTLSQFAHHLEFATKAASNASYEIALTHEFRTLASLRHPHVSEVLDYGFTEQHPFFTMQLIEDARTITDYAEDQSDTQKIDLLLQLLQALHYLHRRDVIHRDLKPENVLVTKDGRVKVVDFGLALSLQPGFEGEDRVAGTLRYLAPELIVTTGRSHSVQSDLWAVGIMAYQLFTKLHPFEADQHKQFLTNLLMKTPDWSELDPALAPWIATLLEKSPADRYTDALEAMQDLCQRLERPLPSESMTVRDSFLKTAPFVGREAELQQLQDALAAMQAGTSGCWLLAGESGSGKSRLLDELRVRALVTGVDVLRGQAVESAGLPFQLWRNIARSLMLSAYELTDLDASILKDIVPDIGMLLDRDVVKAPELTGVAYLQRLSFTLIKLLRQQTHPTLLLLEDLQWATESLKLLQAVLAVLDQIPHLMLVGTYRNEEAPNLDHYIPDVEVIELQRLDRAAVAQLTTAMLGVQEHMEDVQDFLERHSEGNVFFMIDAIQTLAAENERLADIGTQALPADFLAPGMLASARRRLERLPKQHYAPLHHAAVIGREIDFVLLEMLDENFDTEAWLDACANTAILSVSDGRWRFDHDKIRAGVLHDLDAAQLPTLHRRVAEAIETAYPNDAAYDQALLSHWRKAGDFDKELMYLNPVTYHMIEFQGAYNPAQNLLEPSLQLLAVKDPRRVALLNRLTSIHQRTGQFDEALRYAQEASQLAEQVSDEQGLVISLAMQGRIARIQGNYDHATELYQQSLTLAQRLDSPTDIARNLNALGAMAQAQGEYDHAIDLYQQALTMAQAANHQSGIASNLTSLGNMALRQGEYEWATERYQQSIVIGRQLGHQRGIANNLTNLGAIAYYQGDFKRAEDLFQQSLVIRRQIGEPSIIADSLSNLGSVAQKQQDYEQANALFQEFLAIKQQLGDRYGIAIGWANLGAIAIEQEDYDRATTLYQQSLTIRQQLDDRDGIGKAQNNLGVIALEQGQYQLALDRFQDSLVIRRKLGARVQQSESLLYLGWVSLQQDYDGATSYFVESLQLATDIGTPPWQLFNLIGFAALLRQMDQPIEATELLGLVQTHPPINAVAQRRLRELLTHLQAVLATDEYRAALKRGQQMNLEQIVQEVLEQFGRDAV